MAIVVQNIPITAFGARASMTISKPTGLVVGDLMVAHLVLLGNYTTTATFGVPAGWADSGVGGIVAQSSTSNQGSYERVLYKIADSSDVAASNFTFTPSTTVVCAGGLYRIDGYNLSQPIDVVAGAGISDGSGIGTPTTITPTYANSLLMMFFSATGMTSSPSVSGYTIPTDDPIWSEAYDLPNGTSQVMSAAYALRTAITATGNASATFANSGANRSAAAILLAIRPAVSNSNMFLVM